MASRRTSSSSPAAKASASPVVAALAYTEQQPLFVRLSSPKNLPKKLSRWETRLIIGFAVLMFICLSSYLRWGTRGTIQAETVPNMPGVSVSLNYSAYLAYGDDNDFEITLVNTSSQVISGSISLNSAGALALRPAMGKSTALTVPALPPGAIWREKLSLRWDQFLWWTTDVSELTLYTHFGKDPVNIVKPIVVGVTPAPYINKIIGLLPTLLSSIIAAIASPLFGRIKKLLGLGGD